MKRWCYAGWIAALCACSSGTEGKIVQVELVMQPVAEAEAALGSFETATGWQVTLEQAVLALSGIYGYAPEKEPSAIARLSRLFVPVAHAHGGYDPVTGRRVRVELVEPMMVDLLDADGLDLGVVEAEAGTVETFAIEIAAPSPDLPEEMHGHQAWIAGEARRDDEVVRFAGGLDVPDVALTRRIEASADDVVLEEDSTLVLSVRPSVWLREANFDRLEPAAGDEPRAITAESQVSRAWFIGVRSPAAFSAERDP